MTTTHKARGASAPVSVAAGSPAAASATTAATNEDTAVAHYLEAHPDFFERHPAVLARLRIPHVRGAATVSLVERQVEVLREREAASQRRLAEFIGVARANDALNDRIHEFTRRLVRSSSLADTVQQIRTSLAQDFEANDSRLVLLGVDAAKLAGTPEVFARVVDASEPALKSFETLFASGKPRCGQARDVQREFLFGDDAGRVASVALVPLGEQGSLGLLAVASEETQRFHPGMSTEFLARLGDLISDALRRFA
jgi:uncharacterized protein